MNYRESAEELMESMKVLRKNTALQCLSDMSQGEMAVLCYLLFSHNGASAGELTAEFKVRSSRTAAILNGLERKGYAVRSSDPEDKRRVRVYITEKGKNLPGKSMRTPYGILNTFCRISGRKIVIIWSVSSSGLRNSWKSSLEIKKQDGF